ncbi:ATP-dependent DNA helicase Snf21 [Coemansia furcata]|uniref:ATP-dependent DNA helicase Snf21 n=1 Tax=Coemansia furcata TaxID=417177 RepID=A0ACC1LM10_9FUNG|nr:ATP-dependent DNA helicase Snf21 [Coemansia furcata]
MKIQALRSSGVTEQNNKEYAQLMQVLHLLTDSRFQQQQQQQQQQQSAAVSSNDTGHNSQVETPVAATSDSNSSPAASVGALQAESAIPVTLPKSADGGAASTVPPAFSSDNVALLRKQIHAFRLVSRNMPLPPQLRQELWASGIPDTEKRLLDAAPGGLGTPAGNVAEAVHAAVQPQSLPQPQSSTADIPSVGGAQVQLMLPPLPPSVNFVSPHLLLRDKQPAVGDQAARLQRLLGTSITPGGLDVRAMAAEREQGREAWIEYRMRELAVLPANISDEKLDVGVAPNQKYVRPGLLSSGNSSARLKALIELKALGLRHKQRELRTEVVQSITHALQLSIAGDPTALRQMKKHSPREPQLTEKLEREQRQEHEHREQNYHKQQLQAITNHGAGLVSWHRAQQQRMSRLGRAMLAFHTKAETEEQKRMERVARERVQALKDGDEEAYLCLIDKEKDMRISHLINQTDQYLNTLIEAVRRQQQTMVSQGVAQPSAGSPSWLADNAEMDADKAAAAQSRDYYSVAHRVIEPIPVQPRILVGGSLKEYQLRGLEWMVSLYNNQLNGILADKMGLGKTIQTISLVTYLIERKQQSGPFLIIVPLLMITNWILEFEKWVPSVRVIGYKDNPTQRSALKQQIRRQDFQVLLTTYDYVIKDHNDLAKINWVHMIIDEGHCLKNTQSKLAFMLMTYYKMHYHLILTGTPLQNNLPELWALLNFVLPDIFSSAQSFDEWFSMPFANSGGQDCIELNEEEKLLIIKCLHKVLRPFLLRHLKKDVEVDLPGKVEHVIWCGMSAVQSRLYHQMLKFCTLFRGMQMDSSSKPCACNSHASFNNTLMQLRKICNHPFVFEQVKSCVNPTSITDSLIYHSAGKFELLD